jgi:thiamine biosynthesis lipoprotein
MGTIFTVYLDLAEEVHAQACFDAVFDEIDRLEQTFSHFDASSELSRINRHAEDGPMVTDPEVFRLLATALDVSQKTDGVFDITVGRLTRAWGFTERRREIPDERQLAAARKSVGWRHVQLDPEWRTVQFAQTGMELDLGAIAKGYAVDCALDLLRTVGVSALIDAGTSSIAGVGESFSSDWTVSIANPVDRAQPLCEVQIGNRALSTSGVMEQSFVHDGRIYSHLIDPTASGVVRNATGQQVLQVTVLAPTSTLADALSTAMFILGHKQGSVALEQFSDCSALWVYSTASGIACQAYQWPGHDF